jgi:hypothetical protein
MNQMLAKRTVLPAGALLGVSDEKTNHKDTKRSIISHHVEIPFPFPVTNQRPARLLG